MKQLPSPETLVSLLADDAPATRAAVRKALVDLGSRAIPALRRASDGENAALRARARQILLDLRRARGHARLRELLLASAPPLEASLLAIDERLGAADPALDVPGQLDGWAEDVEQRTLGTIEVGIMAGALRSVLSEQEGLRGPERDFHHVDHVSLTRTVEHRRGLPLTLCAIYALVARRAGAVAALLPFPGHVLLHLQANGERRILDPASGGKEVSEEVCRARLSAMGAPDADRWLQPASDASMVVRQVRNLGAAMARHGRRSDANELARLLREVGID